MEEKLNILYKECVEELKNIGIDVLNKEIVGNIEIQSKTVCRSLI